LSHDGNEAIILKAEQDTDIEEQEIRVAVVLPPVKGEYDYHSSMPHTLPASQSTLLHLSTSQL